MQLGLGMGLGSKQPQPNPKPAITKESMQKHAASTGFDIQSLERVVRLFELLEGVFKHSYLKNRLVLKGGTALNLFEFDIPRLSVDIDLNYIGAADRETMLGERPEVERAIEGVCSRLNYQVKHKPNLKSPKAHAGGKWRIEYERTTGQKGTLELDLIFTLRVPLWAPVIRHSKKIGPFGANSIPLLDIHELTAGKLAALFSRSSSRDFFDVRLLLSETEFDKQRLRLAFVVYGAISTDTDWREITSGGLELKSKEVDSQLTPMLKTTYAPSSDEVDSWTEDLVNEVRELVSTLLPLTSEELEFVGLVHDVGIIKPELITENAEMQDKISRNPALNWKAFNVRKRLGKYSE